MIKLSDEEIKHHVIDNLHSMMKYPTNTQPIKLKSIVMPEPFRNMKAAQAQD
ncbi:hypothetical protein [Segatella paludivivens]|uniref:hypothetical protein n=1 Tax=Segatella paludivivens TaxID=185294 RepID=UPI0003695408|nr:hypothetical protein [Segatella paludivivens]